MKFISIIAAILVCAATAALSQTVHYESGADATAAFRIYNGYTGNVVVVITTNGAGANMSATVDGNANTIDGSGNTDTIAELAAAFAAVTNADGDAKLTLDTSVSLAADSTDGELLDGSYTGAPNAWLDIPWDTSAALFYQVALPKVPFFDSDGDVIAAGDRGSVPFKVKKVFGNPTGTGNVTLTIYVDGTAKYSRIYESPVYMLGAGGTNVASTTVWLNDAPEIPVGSQSAVIVRAARATTATTGNIGIIAEQ